MRSPSKSSSSSSSATALSSRSSASLKNAAAPASTDSKVRVVARIRPLSEREVDAGSQETLRKLQGRTGDTALVQVDGTVAGAEKRWYELDAVLPGDASQANVYAESGAQQAVTCDLFEGFNTSILAYGQTGSGKTYTMGTAATAAALTPDASMDDSSPSSSTTAATLDESAGIIPRACADLFHAISEKCVDGTAKVTLSYLELYNEQIRDLFAENNTNVRGSLNNNNNNNTSSSLRLRETPNGSVQVQGCVEKVVRSPAEIGQYMEEAGQKRVVAATAMNATSSRSHAICTLRITGTLKAVPGENGGTSTLSRKKFSSKLTLVDLAGSERIKKTGAQGTRQTEGININKSLLVLGQVVSALSAQHGSGGSKARKPPYRDSKLTRLLQDSLGGNSRTIMVACVSPAHVNLDETTNTLRYAASARRITNKARQNVASALNGLSAEQAAALRKANSRLQHENADLQSTVQKLQEQLQEAQQQAATAAASVALRKRPRSPGMSRGYNTASTTATWYSDDEENDSQVTPGGAEEEEMNVPTQINVEQKTTCGGEENEKEGEPVLNDKRTEISTTAKSSTVSKSETEYILAISNFKLEIAQLKERQDAYEIIEARCEDLQRELAEVKAEADTARMAATYLSDIVDELRDIKQNEIEKKKLQLQMTFKEQSWISFVQAMLENFRMNTSELSTIFDTTVVRKIETLKLNQGQATAPSASSVPPAVHPLDQSKSGKDNSGDSDAVQEVPSQDDLLRMAVESPRKSRQFVRPRRHSLLSSPSLWWGTSEPASPTKPAHVATTESWKECTVKFHKEIRRVERMIVAECESMKSIRAHLAKEHAELEKEVGKQQKESECLFSNYKKDGEHNDLVSALSSMLLQGQLPQTPLSP